VIDNPRTLSDEQKNELKLLDLRKENAALVNTHRI
jgi:hypothetical protein